MMMRFGLVYSIEGGGGDRADRVFREAVEAVALADDLGFDSVFVSEHHFVENGFFPSSADRAVGAFGTRVKRVDDPRFLAENSAQEYNVSQRLPVGIGDRLGVRQCEPAQAR